jgi:hypothetical protein
MITEEENIKEKAIFLSTYLPSFTQYLDIDKLEKKVPNYRYLNDELNKLEQTTSPTTYQHVMSKKKLLISKNAKQLCRDGIPLKYMKPVLLKMFNVSFTKEDFNNKRAEVLKGRKFSEIGDQVPTFCDRTIDEVLPFHYLNKEGFKALKEVLWLLNGVIPKLEYCPCLVSIASILLLFISKEETYELLRNVMEADLNPGDLANIRWHFRYYLNENIRLYLSIVNSILEISKQSVVNQFQLIEKYGLPKVKLIQDMADKFFLDYVNFIGILKFLPFFLYEGVKGIYRYAYGLISICPFKIVKETKKEEVKEPNQLYQSYTLSLLSDQISQKYDFEKRPEAEVLKLYKEVTNKLENWNFFLDTATEWDLTHRNNTYVTLKIPSKIKELFPKVQKGKYIPSLFPDSKILTKDILPKLWEVIPVDVKYTDGQLLFDKVSSPDGDLNAIYKICEKMEDTALIMFVIKTKNGEIFGGIMDQIIKLYDDGRYRIPISAYLFTVEPEIKVYAPKDRQHSEIVCFEAGALRYGNGEDGPAITLENDLKVGWTQKNTVFGNDVCLLKDYVDDGEFIIDNLEIYIMQ